jgi:Na(+)-translocating NADH:ubiquinone oxidoreductase F subunit
MELTEKTLRDYSLIGIEAQKAIEKGLANADWYQSPVEREKMRSLLTRKDGPAIVDTLIWFGLIGLSGYLVYKWWGHWYAILPYMIYCILYASSSDSRWHESSHGTAFKTDWLNNALYEISSFMVFRQSTVWRWSHARHHSDTIIRGRDPEISVQRPPRLRDLALVFLGIGAAMPEWKKLLTHASGKIDKEVATYLPEYEHKKVIRIARIYVAIFAVVIALSVIYQSILPLMLIGLPTLFGTWLMPVYGFTQHAGLDENVLDHRLNCRTVYMNRINRFLYWNMNYHLEHHMFPLVPYHALPKLHELIKDDCPKPYNGIIEAYKEIIPTILKQRKDPTYYAKRVLPETQKNINESNTIKGDERKLQDGKIEVCELQALSVGDIKRFDFNNKTYAIYRPSSDEVFATDGICTHGNTHLVDGIIIGNDIECPKHNGRFGIKDGLPKRSPVCEALSTYPITIENSYIFLQLTTTNKPQATQTFSYKVVSNHNIATYIKELILEPIGNSKIDFKPGQYTKIAIPKYKIQFNQLNIATDFLQTWQAQKLLDYEVNNASETTRNYSMASNPATDNLLRFNVRIALPPANSNVLPGLGSSYVFSLKPNDTVTLAGAFGDFAIKQTNNEMIYLGGGAGMAPLRSHIAYLFETLQTKRKVSFWYGARSKSELFYVDYFEQLAARFENFSFQIALSEPKAEDNWAGEIGYIHEVLYKNYLKDKANIDEVEFYLCGPPVMTKASLEMLNSLGAKMDKIAYDEF